MIRINDRVILKADGNNPEEVGTVLGDEVNSTVIVSIDLEYRWGEDDDGLREVSVDSLVYLGHPD